jgi:lysophospholipase L1-like esterase
MMMTRTFIGLIIIAIVFLACDIGNPKILIIGDSISIGYTPFVEDYFSGKAMVSHNPGNAQHTGTGLKNIEAWVGDENWDIIQFNWGLWDLCYRHTDSKVQGKRDKVRGNITYTLEEYKNNLDSIVSILKNISDARLIFITTTYVPEDEAGRFKDDAVKYNKAAKDIMQKQGILVNDIYERSISIHKRYGKGSNDVHYTKEGYEELSELITNFLTTEIKSIDTP